MENTEQEFNKFSIPTTWGLIAGFVSIFIFTVYGLFLMPAMGAWGSVIILFLSFIVTMLILLYMGMQQRKAMGGYITFKEAFQGIFVAILIVVVMGSIYSYLYMNVIDTGFSARSEEMSVNLAMEMGGEEQADKVMAQAEKQREMQNSIGGQLLGLASTVILYSLFGFIIAAIVKRNKPEHLA